MLGLSVLDGARSAVENELPQARACSHPTFRASLYITYKQFMGMHTFCVVTMSETVCCHLSPQTSRESLSTVLFDALAEARGVEPSELDLCVYHYVDPSALDGLFDSSRGRSRSPSTAVR